MLRVNGRIVVVAGHGPVEAEAHRHDAATMFEYDFMRTAFMAGGVVAIVAGTVGYFLVLRNLTFAGHALSHVGFAGATGSVLIGIGALWGLLAFTLAAAVAMGLLGERLRDRDVAVGIILSLALGFGVLFLYLYTTSATRGDGDPVRQLARGQRRRRCGGCWD